jgi:hypothetical protein
MSESLRYVSTALEPHREALCRMYDVAWSRWEQIPADIRADFHRSGRTVADCIWSLVTREATDYFVPHGIIPRVGNNTVIFPLRGFVLRFKKTDMTGATRNYPTTHSLAFDSGELLIDVPELIRVNVGWVPTPTGTGIAQVVISCSGPEQWVYSISPTPYSADLFDLGVEDESGPIIRPRDDEDTDQKDRAASE